MAMLHKAYLQGSQGQDCSTHKSLPQGSFFKLTTLKGVYFVGFETVRAQARKPLACLAGIHKWQRSRGNSPLAKRRKLHAKSHSHGYVSRLGQQTNGIAQRLTMGVGGGYATGVLLMRCSHKVTLRAPLPSPAQPSPSQQRGFYALAEQVMAKKYAASVRILGKRFWS